MFNMTVRWDTQSCTICAAVTEGHFCRARKVRNWCCETAALRSGGVQVLGKFEPSTRQAEAYRAQMAARDMRSGSTANDAEHRMVEYLYALLRGGSQRAL